MTTELITPLIINNNIDYQWSCCSQNDPKATFAFEKGLG